MPKDILDLLKERKDLRVEDMVVILDRLYSLQRIHGYNQDQKSQYIAHKLQEAGTLSLSLDNTHISQEERDKARIRMQEILIEVSGLEAAVDSSEKRIGNYLEESDLIKVDGELKYEKDRILIVDDEPSIIDLFSKYVQRFNLAADTATNGSEGLEMAFMKNYPVIVSDYKMPSMNGAEMYRQITAKVEKGEILPPNLILCTGTDFDAVQDLNGLKPFALLRKPFRLDDLGKQVESAYRAAMSTQE